MIFASQWEYEIQFRGASSWARRVLGIAGLVLLVSGCGVGSSADPAVTSSEAPAQEVPDDRLDGPPLSDAFLESWCSEAKAGLDAMNRWDLAESKVTRVTDDELMCSYNLWSHSEGESVGRAYFDISEMTEDQVDALRSKNVEANAPVDECEAGNFVDSDLEYRLATTAGVDHCRVTTEDKFGHFVLADFKQARSTVSVVVSIIPGRAVPSREIDPLCNELVDLFLTAYTSTKAAS